VVDVVMDSFSSLSLPDFVTIHQNGLVLTPISSLCIDESLPPLGPVLILEVTVL